MEAKSVLVVEDNDDDILMIKRAFRKGKIGNSFDYVSNGKEALDYLHKREPSRVQLILLDLNMEIMNGFDFLRMRLRLPEIKKIPVVVLTASSRQEDVERAYALEANSYVEKPIEPSAFVKAILDIEDFWIFLAKRP
ncbi:MAG: response regulator [Synergistales bacterium]|nr:response regulator [Synergistales bacterium]